MPGRSSGQGRGDHGDGTQCTPAVRDRPDRSAGRQRAREGGQTTASQHPGAGPSPEGRADRPVRLEGAGGQPGGLRPDRLRQRAGAGSPRSPSGRLAPGPRARRPGGWTSRETSATPWSPTSGACLPRSSLAPSDAQGSAAVAEGRRLFHSIGCASCHTPDLGPIRGIYSDLLLHDMGEELSDPGSYDADDADSRDAPKRGEWRTPPLWGFRDSAPYLHDGRARNLEEAVALHGGQGAASASRFRSMSDLERSQVETFLNSLGAPRRAAPPSRRGSGSPSSEPTRRRPRPGTGPWGGLAGLHARLII